MEPERLMKEGMEQEKKMLQTCKAPADPTKTAVMFERMRGIVVNEEDDSQDYEMVVSADDVTFRGMRNQGRRVADQDRVILAYGRNLNEAGIAILKDLLKLCRTQQAEAKLLKRREDVTEEQAAALQEEFFNQHLPDGWYFDGSMYRTRDEYLSDVKHPNLELLIQRHLDEVNDDIGQFNRAIRKNVMEEQKQYE